MTRETSHTGFGTHWPGCWRAHDVCAELLGVDRAHPVCESRSTLTTPTSRLCVLPHGHDGDHACPLGGRWTS